MPNVIDITESAPVKVKKSDKLKRWIRSHRFLVGGFGALLLLAAAGLSYVFLLPHDTNSGPTVASTPTPTPTPEPKDQANPLNGVMYTATEAKVWSDLRPMAMMVENHVESRPQSGLTQADLIYEAMAEGGITRFMAVYLAGMPNKIGPVRSARMHFVDWANEWDGIYVHWGGSAEAQAYLRSRSRPKNLDQFQNAGAFYRDTSTGKSLEHTGYTSISQLRSVAQKNGWEQGTAAQQWKFKEGVELAARPASQTVTLGFLGTAGYQASFAYQPQTNDYVRSTGGTKHLDAEGKQLTPKVIVLQFQTVAGYTDSAGHAAVRVTTTGTGRAVIIQDGIATEGTWSKPNQQARTQLLDDANQDIPLNRGQIWLISVPTGSPATYL